MKMISKDLSQTKEIAKEFLDKIKLGFYNGATVVGLYGDLGSGKTAFTKLCAEIFNIKEDITSPTFVIEKIYDTNFAPWDKLIHIDAYRLESGKELSKLSFMEQLSDPKNLIFIEWPENVSDILPENHAKIYFRFVSENEREIEI